VTDSKTRGEIFSSLLSFGWMQEIYNTIYEEIRTLKDLEKSLYSQRREEDEKIRNSKIDNLGVRLAEARRSMIEKGMKFSSDDRVQALDYIDRELSFYKLTGDKDSQLRIEKEMERNTEQILQKKRIKSGIKNIQNIMEQYNQEIGRINLSLESNTSEENTLRIYDKLQDAVQEHDKAIQNQDELEKKLSLLEDKRLKFDEEIHTLNSKLNSWNKFIQQVTDLNIEISDDFQINNSKSISNKIRKDIEDMNREIERISNASNTYKLNLKKLGEDEGMIKSLENELVEIGEYTEKSLPNLEEEISELEIGLYPQVKNEIDGLIDTDLNSKISSIEKLEHIIHSLPLEQEKEKIKKKRSEYERSSNLVANLENKRKLLATKTKMLNRKISQNQELSTQIEQLKKSKRIIENKGDSSFLFFIISIIMVFTGISVSFFFQSLLWLGIILSILGIGGSILFILPNVFYPIVQGSKLEIGIRKSTKLHNYEIQLKQDQEFLDIHRQEQDILEIEVVDIKRAVSIEEANIPTEILDSTEIDSLEEQTINIETIAEKLPEIREGVKPLLKKRNLQDELKKRNEEVVTLRKSLCDIVTEFLGISANSDQFNKYWDDLTEKESSLIKAKNALERNQKNFENYVSSYLSLKVSIDSTLEKKSLEKKIENINTQLRELDVEIKHLQAQKRSNSKNIGSRAGTVSELNAQLSTILQKFQFESEISSMTRAEIRKVILEGRTKNTEKLQKISNILNAGKIILNELNEISDYATKYFLFMKEWEKSEKKINKAIANIKQFNAKIQNAIDLYKAWEKVNHAIKTNIESYSSEIIDEIRTDFDSYFADLGDHDVLSYHDLGIKFQSNSVKVSLKVGESSWNSGSPKALFSNGKQVCLILALFLTMSKKVLKKYPLRYVGLDEPTQYLDVDRKADFAELLDRYVRETRDPQVIITTADSEFVQILEEIGSENVVICSISELSGEQFSELSSTYKVPSIARRKETSEGSPHTSSPYTSSPPLIDIPPSSPTSIARSTSSHNIHEMKEFICRICHEPFEKYEYSRICDKSACIKELRQSL